VVLRFQANRITCPSNHGLIAAFFVPAMKAILLSILIAAAAIMYLHRTNESPAEPSSNAPQNRRPQSTPVETNTAVNRNGNIVVVPLPDGSLEKRWKIEPAASPGKTSSPKL
jgi:hypothetical protein